MLRVYYTHAVNSVKLRHQQKQGALSERRCHRILTSDLTAGEFIQGVAVDVVVIVRPRDLAVRAEEGSILHVYGIVVQIVDRPRARLRIDTVPIHCNT